MDWTYCVGLNGQEDTLYVIFAKISRNDFSEWKVSTATNMETKGTASPLLALNIRGKRSRRVRSANSTENGVPRRGRPMKHASRLASTKKNARLEAANTFRRQMSVMRKPKPRNGVSELEHLPVELIQQIFLHSLELNLPRTSPALARSLSKESIYSSLILLAFFDDDGRHPVKEKLFVPAQYRELDLAEKLRLQTSILNSRWCTLHRLRCNLRALSHLAIVQAWHEERDRELQSDVAELGLSPITPSPALQAIASLPVLGDIEATEQHFLAVSSESSPTIDTEIEGGSMYLPRLRTWTSSKDKDGQTYKTIDGARGILNVRCIPNRLLRGSSPWTAEKLNFLKFLRQGWRFLQTDFFLKISPMALFDGMASAIAECNAEALTVLLELHFAAFQDESSHASLSAAGRVRYAVSFSHPLPLELFHLATRQRNSAELMGLLLREGVDSIGDDATLTKWALTARSDGDSNKVAEWLLKHMEGTEDYGLTRLSLFVNGNMTWRRAAGDYPFPEVSFTDELGYLKDGALDFRPQRLDM